MFLPSPEVAVPEGALILVERALMDGPGERHPHRDGCEAWLQDRRSVHHPAVEFLEVVDRLDPRERPGGPSFKVPTLLSNASLSKGRKSAEECMHVCEHVCVLEGGRMLYLQQQLVV